jgi:hypothetical protein
MTEVGRQLAFPLVLSMGLASEYQEEKSHLMQSIATLAMLYCPLRDVVVR